MSRALTVALVLVCSAAGAEQPLPVYPGTIHTRIGKDLVVGGKYHRLAYFKTEDSMRKVAAYFARLWEEEGYPTFVDGDLEQEGVVSAFMTREGLQRSVVLRKHEGMTVGFTVLKDLWIDVETDPRAGAALLPMEGALFVDEVVHKDTDGTAWQRSQVLPGEVDGVRNEVVARMKSLGYELIREGSRKVNGQPHRVLEHVRRGQQVVSVLSPMSDKMVGVHQTFIGSDRVDAIPNDVALEKLRRERAKEQGGRR